MTIVTDYKQCRQCGFERADYELDCSTSEERVDCRKCGHSEAMARVEDDGKVTWKHVVREGSGVLAYDSGHAFVARYLYSEEDVLWAEGWLRERLAAGEVDARSAYLTRWNGEKKAVEFVIGSFYESPADDPPAPAKPAKPTIPIWIHPQKLQNYANSFELPKCRQEFLDMVQGKIDTHDQAWFTRDVEGKRKYVVFTEPENPAEWTKYEV
jgi:hypothetical protein